MGAVAGFPSLVRTSHLIQGKKSIQGKRRIPWLRRKMDALDDTLGTSDGVGAGSLLICSPIGAGWPPVPTVFVEESSSSL